MAEWGKRNLSSIGGPPRQRQAIDQLRPRNSEIIEVTNTTPDRDFYLNASEVFGEQPLGATPQNPYCIDEDFVLSVAERKTVYLRCSLRLDAEYDGPEADLREILGQTLDAMGHYGRDILDRNSLTKNSTFHICKEVNCELLH